MLRALFQAVQKTGRRATDYLLAEKNGARKKVVTKLNLITIMTDYLLVEKK